MSRYRYIFKYILIIVCIGISLVSNAEEVENTPQKQEELSNAVVSTMDGKGSIEQIQVIEKTTPLQPGDKFNIQISLKLDTPLKVDQDKENAEKIGIKAFNIKGAATLDKTYQNESERSIEKTQKAGYYTVDIQNLVYTGHGKSLEVGLELVKGQFTQKLSKEIELSAYTIEEVTEALIVDYDKSIKLLQNKSQVIPIKVTNKENFLIEALPIQLVLYDIKENKELKRIQTVVQNLKARETRTCYLSELMDDALEVGEYKGIISIYDKQYPVKVHINEGQEPTIKEEKPSPEASEEEANLEGVQEVVIGDIILPTDVLKQNELFKVKFNVSANKEVHALNISIEGEECIIPKSQNLFLVDTLKKGETKQYSVDFMPTSGAKSKEYPLKVMVTYGEEKQEIIQQAYIKVQEIKDSEEYIKETLSDSVIPNKKLNEDKEVIKKEEAKVEDNNIQEQEIEASEIETQKIEAQKVEEQKEKEAIHEEKGTQSSYNDKEKIDTFQKPTRLEHPVEEPNLDEKTVTEEEYVIKDFNGKMILSILIMTLIVLTINLKKGYFKKFL